MFLASICFLAFCCGVGLLGLWRLQLLLSQELLETFLTMHTAHVLTIIFGILLGLVETGPGEPFESKEALETLNKCLWSFTDATHQVSLSRPSFCASLQTVSPTTCLLIHVFFTFSLVLALPCTLLSLKTFLCIFFQLQSCCQIPSKFTILHLP